MPRERPITLADAMVLVAAIGIGCFLGKDGLPWLLWESPRVPGTPLRITEITLNSARTGYPILLALSVSVLLLRFTRHTVPVRLAVAQPGTIACVLVVVSAVLEFARLLARTPLLARPGGRSFPPYVWPFHPSFGIAAGYAVTCGWLALLCAGGWRLGSSWLDHLGVGVGIAWLLLGVVCAVVM